MAPFTNQDFLSFSFRHSVLVRYPLPLPPASPPDPRAPRAPNGADLAPGQTSRALSQGCEELCRGVAHAGGESDHNAGPSLFFLCHGHETDVLIFVLGLKNPPAISVFQAFRRTMALSQGDVDEAVLFAKVTNNSL